MVKIQNCFNLYTLYTAFIDCIVLLHPPSRSFINKNSLWDKAMVNVEQFPINTEKQYTRNNITKAGY